MSLLAALSLLLLSAGTPATGPCNPIAGWEQVLADERARWIVIGELHGTEEIPRIFADAVCLTARARPVVVAVEQPSSDQAAIDAFIASDGGDEARHAFLGASMWNLPMKDGRSSEAYFQLFETLRRMRADGRIESVVAFQPSAFTARPTPAEYERTMADILLENAEPGATLLALVGNVHAMRSEVPWEPKYMAMAGHLPADATVTLNVVGQGGEAWICGASGPSGCGVSSQRMPRTEHARGVELAPDGSGRYSGVLHLGAPTSASAPQRTPASEPE